LPKTIPAIIEVNKTPLVSIVTPAYNAMPYIVETIESVRKQQYPSIEHIIFDGGSTDGTIELLKNSPGLVWVSEPDLGQSDALNKSFRRAQGEIIGWLNADDTYQPDTVATAVKFLIEHPEVDLVHGDMQIIDENSHLVGVSRGEPFDLVTILFRNGIKQPTVFMRRKVVEKLGGVDEQLHYVMDRDLWLRAGLFFTFGYLPGLPLANFRLCPGTKSFEQTPNFRLEWQQVLERVNNDINFKKIPVPIKLKALRKNRAAYYLAHLIRAIEQQDRKMILHYFLQTTIHDWQIIFNRGMWLLILKGVLGIKHDRLGRFR